MNTLWYTDGTDAWNAIVDLRGLMECYDGDATHEIKIGAMWNLVC